MAAPGPSFFSPWAAPPGFAEAPIDGALEQRISKLAEFAAKNGPPFVEMIRQKQTGNPEYAFLNNGLGADYFSWRLYCYLYNLQPDRPLQLAPGQPPPHQTQGPATSSSGAQGSQGAPNQQLPTAVESAFAALLAKLSGTRASIKESKEWFMAHAQFSGGLVARMLQHQQQLPTYEQQLHVIYLANDVLLKSLLQRDQGEDPVAAAFRGVLPAMFHSACIAGGSTPEVQERLGTIADHWQGRQVYSPAYIAELKQAMMHGPRPAAPPPQLQPQAPVEAYSGGYEQPPPPQMQIRPPQMTQQPWQQPGPAMPGWGQPPIAVPAPHMMRPDSFMPSAAPLMHPEARGWDAPPFMPMQPRPPFPVAMSPMQPMQPGWGPPPAVAPPMAGSGPMAAPPAAVPKPQKPPTDPMSFPPGLLPGLVEEHLRTEEAYTPLSERDVARAAPPAASDPGPRLQARLAKFYAELQDYRPGSSRADLEDSLQRSRPQAASAGGTGAARGTPAVSDGSFKGERRDGGPAGLGFASDPTSAGGIDDPFSMYRKQRSGVYHETLGRLSAATSSQPVG